MRNLYPDCKKKKKTVYKKYKQPDLKMGKGLE